MNCGVCNHREVCRCFPNPEEYCSDYEPERPHGEWVQTYYSIDGVGASRFKCSKCENEISKYGKPYNFCPNCGAPMTEEAFRKYNGLKEGEAE